ncbi:hypothetical protein Tco_1322844 [Tanacetum coccineum]
MARDMEVGRDLPRDILLDSVVVLRYEKRIKSEIKGKVSTEMELVLEQTQQGTSHEVSVSAKGVEELKIKGEKKEALLTLRQKSEHPSDTKVFTMTMEILLEPTSNKISVVTHWFTLIVLSPLRRSDNENMVDPHGLEGLYKDGRGVRPSESDEVLKLKNLKKDVLLLKLSSQRLKKSMSMSVQKSQVHKMAKITRWRKEIMLS